MELFLIFAIFGLSFAIKEINGPFGIISKFRNLLMKSKYFGVFFYELLSCYFCVGFWSGIIIYLISNEHFRFGNLFIFGFAGAMLSMLFSMIMEKI